MSSLVHRLTPCLYLQFGEQYTGGRLTLSAPLKQEVKLMMTIPCCVDSADPLADICGLQQTMDKTKTAAVLLFSDYSFLNVYLL